MKRIVNRIKEIYSMGDVSFFCSLIGPLTMGTIHLVATILHFDWIVVNYCVFSYLMALAKTWQWAITKFRLQPNHYVAGAISVAALIAPMMASIVLTIRYQDAPHYIFDWLVYAYALYGTIKMVLAIMHLAKKEKDDRQFVLAFLGMIAALYTIQMMEFKLIMFASNGEVGTDMYLMQLFTQGAVFLFAAFVIGFFIYKVCKNGARRQN